VFIVKFPVIVVYVATSLVFVNKDEYIVYYAYTSVQVSFTYDRLVVAFVLFISMLVLLCFWCCYRLSGNIRDGADVRDGEFLGQMPGVGVNVIKSLRATAEVTADALKLRHIDPC